MSDKLQRILCVVLAMVMVLSLSACRHSPVLEQTVYTADGEVDPNNQQTDNDEEHSEQNTTLPPRTTQQTASRQSEQTKVSAKPRSNPNPNNNRTNTSKGNQTPTNGNNSNGQNNRQNPNNPNSGDNKAQGNTPGVDPDPNSGNISIDDKAPYDPSKIPENLAKVAAVGDVGLYVEMLGGSNRLVATSEDLKNNPFAGQVFSDLGQVTQVWAKDGNNGMSSTEFDALLSSKPEAVFHTAGSFTQEQLDVLDAQEIYAIILAPFNTTSNIITNVQTLGRVLGKPKSLPNAPDANKRAEAYIKWFERVTKDKGHTFSGPDRWNLDQASNFSYAEEGENNVDAGQYTILIEGWDSSVSAGNDSGVAYTRTGYSKRNSPVSYFLSLGGAANMSVLVTDDGHTYFPVSPTSMELGHVSINGDFWLASDAQIKSRQLTGMYSYVGLDNFKKIIVDSLSTAEQLNYSNAWYNYGQNYNADNVEDYGYLNESGQFVKSNVHGDRVFVVNPYGIGSWTNGSPESPLEVLWAEQIFYFDRSETDAFNAIRDEVSQFYHDFYGINDPSPYLDDIRDAVYKPTS